MLFAWIMLISFCVLRCPALARPPCAAHRAPAACGPACSPSATRLPGVLLRGRTTSFSCGTADTYLDCYRECGCWWTSTRCSSTSPEAEGDPPAPPSPPCGDAPEVACNYVAFSPNDTRCAADGSQGMCTYLSTITGADPAPTSGAAGVVAESGVYGSGSSYEFDGEQQPVAAPCVPLGCLCAWPAQLAAGHAAHQHAQMDCC